MFGSKDVRPENLALILALLHQAETPQLSKVREAILQEANNSNFLDVGIKDFLALRSFYIIQDVSRIGPEKPTTRYSVNVSLAEKYGLNPIELQNELRIALQQTIKIPFDERSISMLDQHHEHVQFSFHNRNAFLYEINHSDNPFIAKINKQFTGASEDFPSSFQKVWAFIANNKQDIAGSFFLTNTLVAQCKNLNWPPKLFGNQNWRGDEEKVNHVRNVMQQVADVLKREGVGRLGYFDAGGYSIAFETIPDQKGKQQLIMLTPGNEEYVPHPQMLPDRKVISLKSGPIQIQLRISTELRRYGATIDEITAFKREMEDSGLKTKDLLGTRGYRTDNILTCKAQSGEKLIYCNDRGAVCWPANTLPEEKEARMCEWEKNPRYEIYRKNNARLLAQNGIAGVFTPAQKKQLIAQHLPEGMPAPSSSLEMGLHQKGMYPKEVDALMKEIWEASQDLDEPGTAWRSKLADAVKNFDPSKRAK